jgi:hypothetical protein
MESELGKKIRKNLSIKEHSELVALEYVLTWQYSNNLNKDAKRHKYLSNKKWMT